MQDQIIPVSVRGRYLWRNEERFIIKGAVYQNNYIRATTAPQEQNVKGLFTRSSPPSDPIADDQLEVLSCSIPLLLELGINTLLIYSIDNTKSHDVAMDMLAKAGIYVIAGLSTPQKSVNRAAPFDSYTPDLLQHYFATVDRMAVYPNTLGVVAANEVLQHAGHTVGAPVIRALVRDVKRYMALHVAEAGASAAGEPYRVLPVGVISNGMSSIFYNEFRYFTGGNPEEAVDFFSWNEWSWVGQSSMQVSGWNRLVESFENAHVPVFFAEYGTTSGESTPRKFYETSAIYSPEMTRIFSGACVYEFFEGSNRYGLAVVRADGTIEKLRAFDNLKGRLQACAENEVATLPEWVSSSRELIESNRPEVPVQGADWRAPEGLPECPLDWDEVRTQIEDRQWIDVADEVERSILVDAAESP
ncbi:Glucanosyltransferase-domain-containing protein [Apiospora arundinis]|uniref:1,3-beta-glucanosyltransferase n=1 Tax=Apiospora arundinis TaxID=335852 RepID=A0ABR2HY82_9PEZI